MVATGMETAFDRFGQIGEQPCFSYNAAPFRARPPHQAGGNGKD